jgi:hypothetical protein
MIKRGIRAVWNPGKWEDGSLGGAFGGFRLQKIGIDRGLG